MTHGLGQALRRCRRLPNKAVKIKSRPSVRRFLFLAYSTSLASLWPIFGWRMEKDPDTFPYAGSIPWSAKTDGERGID